MNAGAARFIYESAGHKYIVLVVSANASSYIELNPIDWLGKSHAQAMHTRFSF